VWKYIMPHALNQNRLIERNPMILMTKVSTVPAPEARGPHRLVPTVKTLLLTLAALWVPGWMAMPALGIDRHWVGQTNPYWSEPSNWNPAGAPQNGDDLDFDGGNDSNQSMVNDVVNLTVNSLNFGNGQNSEDYQLSDNSVTVNSAISSVPSGSSTITINCPLVFPTGGNVDAQPESDGNISENTANLYLNGPITVGSGQLTLTSQQGGTSGTPGIGSNGRIFVSGLISGAGDVLVRSGANTYGPDWNENDNLVEFDGAQDNALSGTLYLSTLGNSTIAFNMASGVVETNRVEVRDGNTASLNLSGANQIGASATIQIDDGSQLLLSGNNVTAGTLVLNNFSADALPSILDTGGTTLGLNGGITSSVDNDTVHPTIKGTLNLNGFLPFNISGGPVPGLEIQAVIEGNGFQKVGDGTLILSGNNTFFGDAEITVGTVEALTATAFGQAGPTYGVEIDGGTLVLQSVNIGAEPLFVNSQASFLQTYGTCSWGGPVTLNTDFNVIPVDVTASGLVMNFSGPISGSGGLDLLPALFGVGNVELSGSSANTFTGATTVNCQLLEFDKPSGVNAYTGPLIVGGAAGSAIHEARWLDSYQNVGATLTLYTNGLVNLDNNNEDFGAVTFNGGTVDSGPSGQFAIYQPLTVNPAGASAVIDGVLGLPAGNSSVFMVGSGGGGCDLIVNAIAFGSPTYFVKQGAGTMCLTAANTFNAVTLLEGGVLDITDGSALGTQPGLVIFDGATLRLDGSGTLSEGVEVVGTGVGGVQGAIEVTPNNTFNVNGGILLDSATTLNIGQGAVLSLNNSISGSGPLTQIGSGNLVLSGGTANTYTGDTVMLGGTLYPSKSAGMISVPGNLVLGPGASGPVVAVLQQSGAIGGAQATVNANSLLNLNSNNLTLATLNLNDGGSVQTGAGELSFPSGGVVNVGSLNLLGSHASASISGSIGLPANATLSFNVGAFAPTFPFPTGPELDVPAFIPRPIENESFVPAGISKAGPGRMRLDNTNTYAGRSAVEGGTLQVDGSLAQSQVTVESGTLLGAGTVGPIYATSASASVSPGDNGTGSLTSGNLDSGGGAGTFQVELNGTTPGSGYSQLNVQGSVDLTGIALSGVLNFTLPTNELSTPFILINNGGAGPVIGTFTGLPQDATVNFGGRSFRVSYTEGDGNDVGLIDMGPVFQPVLTIEQVPPDSVRLLWATNNPAFNLYFATNLPSTNWAAALPLPVIIGSNNVVSNAVDLEGVGRFYRLSIP
jgi:autotransporter-associated beta strand protein